MARTKQTARRSVKPLTTWTRFHLPRNQEWPTWSVDHDDVHAGPLKDVEGRLLIQMGRMVTDPEQAAYIIQWRDLDALKNFQSSPACAEFLRNLPEPDDSQASIESGSALRSLSLTDASSSSSAPGTSRFLVFEHVTAAVTSDVEGLVTLTAFLVPRKVDSVFLLWREKFEKLFAGFRPPGYDTLTHETFAHRFSAVWLWALAEDVWVENKFGRLEQTSDDGQGRTVICHFHLWKSKCGATPEMVEAAAADPRFRESWNWAAGRVMPPATSWVQEHWYIQDMPRPPTSDDDEMERPEYEIEQERRMKLFFKARGLDEDDEDETME